MIKIHYPNGTIEITRKVLASLVGYAVTNCYGVAGMVSRNSTDGISELLKVNTIDRGVRVWVEDACLSVDLHIMVTYGVNLKAITESIIHKVRYCVENATGFKVKTVNVYVDAMKID